MKRSIAPAGIKRALLILALALFGALAVQATEMKGQVMEVQGYKLELSFMSEPVVGGKNQMMITVQDSTMKPVEGAVIKTSTLMDQGMQMGSNVMAEQKPIVLDLMRNPDTTKMGEYMADISFPYDGKWVVQATVQSGTDILPATFEVEVGKAGPNMVIIGGFLGLIALVIIIAAISKARSSTSGAGKA